MKLVRVQFFGHVVHERHQELLHWALLRNWLELGHYSIWIIGKESLHIVPILKFCLYDVESLWQLRAWLSEKPNQHTEQLPCQLGRHTWLFNAHQISNRIYLYRCDRIFNLAFEVWFHFSFDGARVCFYDRWLEMRVADSANRCL